MIRFFSFFCFLSLSFFLANDYLYVCACIACYIHILYINNSFFCSIVENTILFLKPLRKLLHISRPLGFPFCLFVCFTSIFSLYYACVCTRMVSFTANNKSSVSFSSPSFLLFLRIHVKQR